MYNDIVRWTATVLELKELCGKNQFYPKLNELLLQVTEFDEILILDFANKANARLLWQREKIKGDEFDFYLKSAFVLDPFYRLGVQEKADGFFRLAEIIPDDFDQYENYYDRYFRHLKIIDEIGYLIQIPEQSRFIHIELANFKGSEEFSKDALTNLQSLFNVIKDLVIEHHVALKEKDDEPLYEMSYVEDFHRLFGTEIFTPREHDVTLLMLQGYSVKAIATHLGIGNETIKMHRKNIYSKLGVCSQSELLALFIDLLVMVEPPVLQDPLVSYTKKLCAA